MSLYAITVTYFSRITFLIFTSLKTIRRLRTKIKKTLETGRINKPTRWTAELHLQIADVLTKALHPTPFQEIMTIV